MTVALPGQRRRAGARRPLPRPARPGADGGAAGRSRAPSARVATWLIAAGFGALYAADSLTRYRDFRSGSWDLALFTEAVKQYAHLRAPIVDVRGPGYNLLGEHFHPILALLAPFFALWPTPATLLVAQALLFAASVAAIGSLAVERLGRTPAHVLTAAYGASFGLVQAADFDFHELAFAVPLIAFALLALQRGRSRLLILACVGLLCTKEEFGATVVLPLGLAWMLRDRTRWRRRLPLAAAGLAASLIQIKVLIPALNPEHVYGFLAAAGSTGSTGNVEGAGQLLADPGPKLHLLLLLAGMTAFTALFSPLALLAVPDLLMRFASSNPYYWGTDYHYNAVLMPILFAASIDAIARRRLLTRANLGAAAVGIAALWLLPDFALWHAFDPPGYTPGPAHLLALRTAVDEVPDGATVEGTLDVLAPLAAKADTFWAGNAQIDPPPQYVVFDTLNDGYGTALLDVAGLEHQWHPDAVYSLLWTDDGVDLLKLEHRD